MREIEEREREGGRKGEREKGQTENMSDRKWESDTRASLKALFCFKLIQVEKCTNDI